MKNESQEKVKSSSDIMTIVGRGTYIKGSISLKNSGRIDGHVEGDVTSDQDVVVGEGGVIEGRIVSRSAVIGGKVIGPVNAMERVALEEKAELQGDIHTGQLKIADGVKFNGYCHMLRESEKKDLSK